MADGTIEERFAAFEEHVSGTFRPAPVGAMTARVRRRRWRRRSLLAGLLAALVAAPAGGFAMADRNDGQLPPNPVVTPSPTVSRAFPAVERRVSLPGVDIPLAFVSMVDAQQGWAFFRSCTERTHSCRQALGSTTDGGRTWRKANLPDLKGSSFVNLYPLDGQTLTLHNQHEDDWRFYLTTDGGATFTPYPKSAPPVQAHLALGRLLNSGEFRLLCPGATGFEDGADAVECEQQLRRTTGAPVTQPALAGQLRDVAEGGERLWVTAIGGTGTRLAVSTDHGGSWREVGSVPERADLTVSPDGADVWLVASDTHRLWRLKGSTLVEQPNLPDQSVWWDVKAAGGGVLALRIGEDFNTTAGLWRDGTVRILKGLNAAGVHVLRDGTVLFQENGPNPRLEDWPPSVVLGTGTGLDRGWIRQS